jgi:carbonic anhydrase/acetyltransferase-like protein (isoleucine patch superfamily)
MLDLSMTPPPLFDFALMLLSGLLHRMRVGDEARIGAGAVVTKDVPAATAAVGVPAASRLAEVR